MSVAEKSSNTLQNDDISPQSDGQASSELVTNKTSPDNKSKSLSASDPIFDEDDKPYQQSEDDNDTLDT